MQLVYSVNLSLQKLGEVNMKSAVNLLNQREMAVHFKRPLDVRHLRGLGGRPSRDYLHYIVHNTLVFHVNPLRLVRLVFKAELHKRRLPNLASFRSQCDLTKNDAYLLQHT